MEQKEIVQTLTKVLKTSTVLENEPMRNHTTFHIGGNADVYIKVKEEEDSKTVFLLAKEHHIPLTIIGNASNVLVTDKGIRGMVLEANLKKLKFEEKQEGTRITVRCGRKPNGSCR